MAFAAWQATIVDEGGNVQASAAIEVLREVAGQPPAQCYSDRAGSTPIGSTFSADADGFVRFFVAGGAYQITATLGAFSRVWRYVAIGTAAETDAGLIPTSISTGWLFDDTTADADPGSGLFRLNNADPASATAIYLDNEQDGAADVTAWLDSLDDGGGSTIRGHLFICDPDQPTEVFRVYLVSGSVVDGTGYRKLTVAHVAGAGALTAGTLYSITFAAKGAPGEVTSVGASVAGQLAAFTDTGADEIEGADLGDSPPTPVVVGNDAAIRASTPGSVIHAGHLESASAVVTLTDDTTIAINWASGVNFDVTLTTNRILGNPTNEVAGQWRTVLVKSDGGPDTLTFGAEYGGEVPTIDDVTTTKFYLLMIYCKAAGQFLVSAIDGSDA